MMREWSGSGHNLYSCLFPGTSLMRLDRQRPEIAWLFTPSPRIVFFLDSFFSEEAPRIVTSPSAFFLRARQIPWR